MRLGADLIGSRHFDAAQPPGLEEVQGLEERGDLRDALLHRALHEPDEGHALQRPELARAARHHLDRGGSLGKCSRDFPKRTQHHPGGDEYPETRLKPVKKLRTPQLT